jgi:hypothetical protein
MNKPKKRKKEIYDYIEIEDFIKKKYKIDLRDYKGEDFWNWLCDVTDVRNDSDNYIPLSEIDEENVPEPIVEILKMFKDEFGCGNDDIDVHHSW